MTRETVLIILGVLVLISPFIGLPLSWLAFVLPPIALGIIIIAMTQRARRKEEEHAVLGAQ